MKVYIAGKLCNDSEREFLEEITRVCEEEGFETFLPHREAGIIRDINDVERIFREDIEKGLRNCKLVIADLNGLHVGAGTAWELGYAYAKGIPCLGIKTDEGVEEALDYLSAILIFSVNIVDSVEKLRGRLKSFKSQNRD